MPKVSIIIPTYNSQDTIKETIASVQKQSLTDWELIIIDDGSSDNTVKLIREIDESRIKLVVCENGGVSVARNRGIARCQGEYIAFLDADDLWTENKLSSQTKALDLDLQAQVVYSWTKYVDERGELLFAGPRFSYRGDVFKQLLQRNFLLNASNILIRRDVLDLVPGFDPELTYAADWDFYLRLAKNFNFVLVPDYQTYYRQSDNSMSTKIEAMRKQCLDALDLTFEDVADELKYLKDISHSNFYLYCADLYRKRISAGDCNGLRSAWQSLHQAIALHPNNLLKIDTQRILIKLFIWDLFLSFRKYKFSIVAHDDSPN